MRFIQRLCLFITLSMWSFQATASPDWMTATLDGLASLFNRCLSVPPTTNFNYGSQALNLLNSGAWVNTGSRVQGGKMVQINWSTIGMQVRPRQHQVIYRIDPRFSTPQIFIQTYDYYSQKYISDFHQFKSGQLAKYQNNPDMVFQQRVQDYTNYFNFSGRSYIPVYEGDVVNISLSDIGTYFANSDNFTSELSHYSNPLTIAYSATSNADNSIIYAPANVFCQFLNNTVPSAVCNNNTYLNSANSESILTGFVTNGNFTNLQSCPTGATFNSQTSLCAYDQGRGMRISVGGSIIKNTQDSFIHSPFNGSSFIYYESPTSGNLLFSTEWNQSNMFVNNPNQLMQNWSAYTDVKAYEASIIDKSAKYLHFGRYILSIEIGSGSQAISNEQQGSIKVAYAITNGSIPNSGTNIGQSARFDASQDGYLWLQVTNPSSEIQGTITAQYGNYTGTTIFSDILYNDLIAPLRSKFDQITKLFYTKLVTDPTLQNIAMTMLTLYVLLYGIFFLAGSTQITVNDIVIRVSKIAIIVALFSPTSWNFFNDNLFNMFVYGSDYLMSNVTNMTSSTSNIFGFIDPIFDRYTNPRVWGLLLLQVLQIHNGLFVFAIMTIYAILLYCRAVLEVIVGYCLAFVGLSVMISLAPFFIILILFEKTKSLFDNWMSTLFSYMIQPTLLLVFFLLIDQIISTQLTKTIIQACWGCWIPLEIGVDLKHLGIPISFSFVLPFLPCIPFFVTQVNELVNANQFFGVSGTFMQIATSSLLFYTLCLMSYGLVEYVSEVVSILTNVMSPQAAAKAGGNTETSNPIRSVMGDLNKVAEPIKNVASAPFRLLKEKVIDGKYRNQKNESGEDEDYSDKIKSSRQDGETGLTDSNTSNKEDSNTKHDERNNEEK